MPVTDQGVTLDRYMLIPRVLIFLTRGRKVLLLKGAPTKRIWANKYNGVGGHVEPGETILAAAWRELLEETGLNSASIQDLRLRGTVVVDTRQNPGIGMYIFTGVCSQGDPAASEEGTLEWVPLDAIQEYPTVEDLPVLLKRIALMEPDAPPFSARSFYQGDRLVVEFA